MYYLLKNCFITKHLNKTAPPILNIEEGNKSADNIILFLQIVFVELDHL